MSNQPIRIAYLASDPSISLSKPGGPSTHINSTVRGLRKQGLDVHTFFASSFSADKNANQTPPNPQQTIRKGKHRLGATRALFAESKRRIKVWNLPEPLVEKLISLRPHVIYERSSVFSSAGSRLARELRCQHFLETSCCEAEIFAETYGLFSVRLTNFLEARKLRAADAVVTQSQACVAYARAKFGLPEKATVIAKPLAYELPKEHEREDKGPPTQAVEFASQFKLCVLFIGTFGSYQGPDFLMKLIIAAHKKYPQIGFLLCGAGGKQKECVALSEAKSLKNVLFTGMLNQDELASTMQLADIAIVPDCERTMSPIKTLHYGAFGLPVLVPDYEAFEGLIEHGTEGFRFPSCDIDRALSTLGHCLNENTNLEMMGQNWQRKVSRDFNEARVVQRIVELVQQIGDATGE